jgi:hypothetical protein
MVQGHRKLVQRRNTKFGDKASEDCSEHAAQQSCSVDLGSRCEGGDDALPWPWGVQFGDGN